jgi:tetratricopeptide (TPR) repeat protein
MRGQRAAVSGQPPAAALATAVAVLLLSSVGLAVVRDRAYPRSTIEATVLYVQSGAVLERLALSFDALVADVYWIRAIQHYGGTRRSTDPSKRYHLLEPLLSLAVSLDPHFNIVYRFGAIFLAEPWPGGPGRPDQAIALLERGLRARPGNWRYMQDIGFIHYWWLHDYERAAAWFERAAAQPGAPPWLRALAASTLAEGGRREASRALWTAIHESAEEDWLRQNAARRLRQLDALDQRDRLQALVDRYVAAGGPKPYTWRRLVERGYLAAVPLDPEGVPFELGEYSGSVEIAADSPLQPMPAEPPAARAR